MTPLEQVEEFLHTTLEARELAQKCRDYFDNKQWTEAEAERLRSRGQAPIVVNRVKPKVEGLVGLYDIRKTDPKAFPRTPKHEEAANAVTDGLRYVAGNTNFDMTRLDVAEDFFVEGYGAVFIPVRKKGKDVEIQINQIPWDRFYYDSRSRRKDFKDARYMGIFMWMDTDVAAETFKVSKKKLDQITNGDDDGQETLEDRPRWRDKGKRERIRIAVHFHLEKGKWKMTIFSGEVSIKKTQDSPYHDEDGNPTCPIEAVSANIDRNNDRYGEVSGFLSQQDEINHRRSKFLHLNTQRQTFGNQNAIQDVDAAKKELSKPNGHLQLDGKAKLNEDFGILPTGDMSQAQFQLYLDAKGEMDAVSFNAQLSGSRQEGDLSGKAIGKLQQAGVIELSRKFSLLANWERRVYEQVWCRIKQYWKEEKWVRVTDDADMLRYVGFNTTVTAADLLAEQAADKSLPLEARQQAAQVLELLVQTQNPRLNETVETKNPLPELEMDMTIEQSFDVINIQEEQFQALAQFGQGSDIDIVDLIELSQLRGKKELIEKIESRRTAGQPTPEQQAAMQLEMADRQAGIAKTQSETEVNKARAAKTATDAVNQQLENILIQNNPDTSPQVYS